MRISLPHKALGAFAAALLLLGTAACADDPGETPPSAVDAAPAGPVSDDGGEETSLSDEPIGPSTDCTLPDGEQSLPNEPPEVDEWVPIQGVGVPVSATYGPEHREGDLFICYAHSPTGALFASVYAFVASGYVPGYADNWIEEGAIPGAADTEGQESPMEGTITLRGYRIAAASEEAFIVDLALEIAKEEGTYLNSTRVTLQWDGDRWLVDPATFEAPNRELDPLMSGFIPWSANG